MSYLVSIYRQRNDGAEPAAFRAPKGTKLAGWRDSYGWSGWLRMAVREGKAIDLGSNGFPDQWTATAGVVLANHLVNECAKDPAAIAECTPDEWLIVEAWDES